MPQVTVSPAAHALEHSLEVHLPFLQTVLDKFTVVPLAVGDASADEVAQVLDALWGGAETPATSAYLGAQAIVARNAHRNRSRP